jgi:hypothetical protein
MDAREDATPGTAGAEEHPALHTDEAPGALTDEFRAVAAAVLAKHMEPYRRLASR